MDLSDWITGTNHRKQEKEIQGGMMVEKRSVGAEVLVVAGVMQTSDPQRPALSRNPTSTESFVAGQVPKGLGLRQAGLGLSFDSCERAGYQRTYMYVGQMQRTRRQAKINNLRS